MCPSTYPAAGVNVSEVLVIADRSEGGVRKPTLELLTLARRLGEPSKSDRSHVVL